MDYKRKYYKYKLKYLKLQRSLFSRVESTMHYQLSVSEPWFTLILLGLKTVEGRKYSGVFKEIRKGDTITWTNNDFGLRCVKTSIIDKIKYDSFATYLKSEGLDKCLPGITNLEQGLQVYYKYYTRADEKAYGVVALRLEKVDL